MTGLTVLAVDDELPALRDLARLLAGSQLVETVDTAASAAEALSQLGDRAYDALFLDVRMPDVDGVELARVLRRFARPPAVVFVTAYDEHAVAAFDLHALDYVVKPVRAERLAEAVRRVYDAAADRPAPAGSTAPPAPLTAPTAALVTPAGPAAGPADDGTVPVELAGNVRFVARTDVAFVEAAGDYARLHTAAGSHLVRVPLATLEGEWAAAGFVRIHRSFLVNLRHISELRFDGSHYTVVVAGHELQVSRRHSRELKDRLVRSARPGAS